MLLKIKGISKDFGAHRVLKNITFTIDSSKIIGLAGSSGSGKSTLLRLIQKLETPTHGSIEGTQRTGFVFQDFQLFPHMTLWENICYAPKLNRMAGYKEKGLELLRLLGLSKKINAYPHQISGGQKQRIALARALMAKPDILLCDEPTSGLDVATIQDVISLMEAIKTLGVGIVIASHDLDLLTRVADTIFVLKNGSLTHEVSPRTLSDPIGYLKNLY